MKKRKNLTIVSLLLVVLLGTPLVAQGASPSAPTKVVAPDVGVDAAHRPCCRVIPPRRVLVNVLELSEEQLASVAELARQIAEAVGPLREQLRMLLADLQAELSSEDPDRCLIGDLVLAIRELRVEICETIQSFEDDFLAILTPEQQERWLAIMDRFCRGDDGSDASGG